MIMRKDLVDIGDEDYETRRNEFMQCQDCGFDWGGTQGDYFAMPMDKAFECGECGSENIALVKNVTTTVMFRQ